MRFRGKGYWLSRTLFLATTLLCFLIALPSHCLAGGFSDVGNGGDGVIRSGNLVLRDFAEAGLSDGGINSSPVHPKFQKVASELLARNHTLKWFVDVHLIAQQLTRIESLQDGLGEALALALLNFEFRVRYARLTTLDNDGVEPITQIAIRRFNFIYIDGTAFLKLNMANRIGLLIHEAVFSLQRPACKLSRDSANFDDCEPSSKVARRQVGTLFKRHPSMLEMAELLRGLDIEIPVSPAIPPKILASIPSINGGNGANSQKSIERSLASANADSSLVDFSDFAKSYCRWDAFHRGMDYSIYAPSTTRILYHDVFGIQIRLSLRRLFRGHYDFPADARECKQAISLFTRNAFATYYWF
jgi:hypothetical protein